MPIAIEFANVSKRFTLNRDKPRAFQDLFITMAQRRKLREAQEFWALRDVSFHVERGETVGLIGSNGSGKSTALKLISRIIAPTAGKVAVSGKVTALLELGAGFHPELSGRDNIYLNGTVMGMSRKEIQSKIDSIIDFAELKNFIDVPVKDYSSGMYARLGFSLSIHLDPEILLIDEVLAVGDQSFQQKCAEQILRLRRRGITILFVSHDLDTVARLCSRAVWLDHGQVAMDDVAHDVTDGYFKYVLQQSTRNQQVESWSENRKGSGEARVTGVEFQGEEMHPRRVFLTHEPLIVRVHYEADEPIERPLIGLGFDNAATGVTVAGPNNKFAGYDVPYILGKGYFDFRVDDLPFLPGDYLLTTAIYDADDAHCYDYWYQCARFTVVPGGTNERYGMVALEGKWSNRGETRLIQEEVAAHEHHRQSLDHDRI
jgi:lipopolysaccharide transport system ATP-binding protein